LRLVTIIERLHGQAGRSDHDDLTV